MYVVSKAARESLSSFHGVVAVFTGVFAILYIVVVAAILGSTSGQGSVVSAPLSYTKQLSTGEQYTLFAGVKDRKSHILLVRSGKHNFRAIRITGALPPTHFVLIDGKPVAVTTATGK